MILGVIPARLNSTRFPSKVIFNLKGKPIIEHVYDKAIQSNLLNEVVVAVDSEETKNKINCPNVMMTSDKHQSGTDRVAEVANNFDCDGACYDEMEGEHRNLVETWQEMNPLNLAKAEAKMEKDLFGNPLYERTWQEEH